MNALLIANPGKLILSLLFSISTLSSLTFFAQSSMNKNAAICKQLAIESAQLAHQSNQYAQKNYLELPQNYIDQNTDTAIFYIKESITCIDSAIILASDSDIIAVGYANIARNYAIDTYEDLLEAKNSKFNYQKNLLSQKATFDSENATVDAYHASMYFDKLKKEEKKEEEPVVKPEDKPITKLDIDQTLFTLLKEEIQQKKDANKSEILKLTELMAKAKDPAKKTKFKSKIKTIEVKDKDLDKKLADSQQKLTSINKLIEERDKTKQADIKKEETIFTKSITKTTDEWNKQIQIDSEMPMNLIYQVQLGVFKQKVLPDVFKGLTPIYGKTTEKGVCYSTGMFEKFADAKEAKAYVNSIGLTDAFIVAYNNKKKISIAEAVRLEKK
ncbi:MAG: hypothetical protein SFY56_08610 [Bacteroidota bacterium]|nr:hypothetical protein [Bacteroidota bacterium]